MKKVAFIINSLRGGGAERALARLTMELPRDWEIDIILSDSSNITYEYRGNIIDLGIPKRETMEYYVRSFMKRYFILRKLKKQKNYDACVGFSESASIVNILSGKRYCKILTSVRITLSQASKWRKKYKYIASPFVRLLYNNSDAIITLSEGVRQDLIQNYGIDEWRIKTIYNGFNFKEIDNRLNEPLTEMEPEFFEGKNTIVTMGRLQPLKAQWHLIRAFKETSKVIPNTQLLILGEGKLERYLKELVEELGLKEKVFFAGFQKNPFHILAKCQVFVFPSLYEGFGNALVEAMYCGLPVIATDFRTGAREILAPDTDFNKTLQHDIEYASYGILTPVCDGTQYRAADELTEEEKILAKAMVEMLQSKDLQKEYAQKAKARSEVYDMELFGKQWADVIQS